MQTPSEPKRNSEFGIGSAPPRRSVFGNYKPGELDTPGSSDASVPLTPARSPGRREKQATRGMSSDAPQAVPEQDECHPLPGQAGRGEGEPVDRRTETLQSSIDTALARSFIYRFLAKAFEDPEPEGWQWLSGATTRTALGSAMTTLCERSAPLTPNVFACDGGGIPQDICSRLEPRDHPLNRPGGHPLPRGGKGRGKEAGFTGAEKPSTVDGAFAANDDAPAQGMVSLSPAWIKSQDESSFPARETTTEELLNRLKPDGFDSFHNDYVTCFGHTVRGDCPMNEIEYGDIKADPLFQPHRLADLGAFYAAFGLEMTPDAAQRQDHISIELEFMSVLAAKEAYALEHQFDAEPVVICREAQKKFLREHLGRWTPAFTRRLARTAGDSALGALADLTCEFIAADCARFNVASGSEDLLLRPIDEGSETLCASCGITNLPPGAMSSPVES